MEAENLVAIAIPSKKGEASVNFAAHLSRLQPPINTSLAILSVYDKPVDEARIILVEHAKKMGAKYLFFIDDDVLVPPYALARLLNLKAKVASGVYYTKYKPPVPVILKKDYVGGYDKWQFGDVIDVDYIGLGCALIDMSIFDEIEPPYFKYIAGTPSPTEEQHKLGEDAYFCEKVRNKGYKIWVDTAVQCVHEDRKTGTNYFYFKPIGMGAWREKGKPIMYIPPAESELRKPQEKKKNVNLCWGYGSDYLANFVDVPTIKTEEIVKKYDDVEWVKIRNTLEFMNNEEAIGFLKTLNLIMKDGAVIEFTVPNVLNKVMNLSQASTIADVSAVFGMAGRKYKSIYTKKSIEDMMRLLGFKIDNIDLRDEEIIVSAKKGVKGD